MFSFCFYRQPFEGGQWRIFHSLTGLAQKVQSIKVLKHQKVWKYQSQVCDWCSMFNNALGRPSSWPGPPSPAYQIKEIYWGFSWKTPCRLFNIVGHEFWWDSVCISFSNNSCVDITYSPQARYRGGPGGGDGTIQHLEYKTTNLKQRI